MGELDEKNLENAVGGVPYEVGKESASKFIKVEKEDKEAKIADLQSQLDVLRTLKSKAGFFQRKKYDKEIKAYEDEIESLRR